VDADYSVSLCRDGAQILKFHKSVNGNVKQEISNSCFYKVKRIVRFIENIEFKISIKWLCYKDIKCLYRSGRGCIAHITTVLISNFID